MSKAWSGAARPGDVSGDSAEHVEDRGVRFETLAQVEERHIRAVLAHTGRRIEAAARILGVHRNTLARKIRAYGI